MLATTKGSRARMQSRTKLVVALTLMANILLAGTAALVNVQVAKAQSPRAAGKGQVNAAANQKTNPAHAKSFDLSFLPENPSAIVAIRPAAIGRDPALKEHNLAVTMALAPLLPSLFGSVESIDQVVVGYGGLHDSGALDLDPLMRPDYVVVIRSKNDIDWEQRIGGLVKRFGPSGSTLNELSIEGRRCYKASTTRFEIIRSGECYYWPDARTIVIGREQALHRVVRRGGENRPRLVQGDDWRVVENCPIAMAVETPDLSLVGDLHAVDLIFGLGEIGQSQRLTLGIDNLDAMDLHAIVTFPTAREAGQSALRTLAGKANLAAAIFFEKMGVLGPRRQELAHGQGEDADVNFENAVMKIASRSSKIQCDGRTLDLRRKTSVALKDLVSGLLTDAGAR